LSILIVEDNADVRAHLRRHLQSDYLVMEASDGQSGLDAARERKPDLILSDVMMPGIDGYEMCRLIKSNEELRHIPVILVTAKVGEDATIEGLQSGADAYIDKPFSIRSLKAQISGLIQSRKELREKFRREIFVQPAEISITPDEELFLDHVKDVIDQHLGDGAFNVDWLAEEVGASRRQLERKIKAVVGEPPATLIRRLRLERASQLLRAQIGTVAEVAYTVGFNSPVQFAKAFRKVYGVSPAEYVKESQISIQ
jgi:DNA-binding response OmpR family regulator